MIREQMDKIVLSAIDKGARWQVPIAERYGEWLRTSRPEDSPERILQRAQGHYLLAVTASGVAVGMCAAVPGIGFFTGLAAMGVETVFFVEASVLYALTAANAHGIDPDAVARETALVSGIVFGPGGVQFVGKHTANAAKDWANQLANRIPGVSSLGDGAVKRLVVRSIATRSVLAFGRVVPAGIGAVIGATGNRVLARSVIDNARNAFGPAPAQWDSGEKSVPGAPGTNGHKVLDPR
ncbi:hypothetical protein IU433_30820 [Nocardia puris]|uniref:EcsC family protein n=1 Tax=Nocardia puris TaxID=208602 RepID=A0A366CYP7_9NOCA|nr:hypothetical protein [Nocardia puris]MBF6215225.1 hypothetical protein [Nocardia puris]MBF6369725.1 hypothetical protein [Nocardia puris]MBF6463395.1 hypothetical protein [Nocardia puris]RBO82943.1 hypothetical protein DFR74_12133 [Nocardia puris]